MSEKIQKWGLTTYQILRLAFGLGLLAILATIYMPYLFFTYSTSAVVSARIVTLTTPIDGIMSKAPPLPGKELYQGDVIFEVVNTTVDKKGLSELLIDQKTLEKSVETKEKEKETLIAMRIALEKSKQEFLKSRIERVVYDIEEAKKHYQELQTTALEEARRLERRQSLYKKKNASVSQLDDAFFAHERTKKSVEQAKLNMERLEVEREQIKKGIFINQDGRTEVVYQDQRIDEINIRLLELESTIQADKGRLNAINERIKIEQSRIDGLSRRAIRASAFSVVMRSYVMQGAQVDEKAKVVDIIDCSKVYIDMTLHEGYFDKIKIGSRVDVKLRGQANKIHGTITNIRGGSILAEPDENVAGVAQKRRPHEMQVIIEIDKEDLYESAADLCHVGRTGEVTFQESKK